MYGRTLFFVVILSVFATFPASAQVGKETNFWTWTPRAKHHEAIVKIISGKGHGTGVIVYADKKPSNGKQLRKGYCLTAAHVVEAAAAQEYEQDDLQVDGAAEIKQSNAASPTEVVEKSKPASIVTTATFHNGHVSRCQIVEFDRKHDVAVISLLVPQDVKPAAVGKQAVHVGDTLEFSGLGGAEQMKECMRHFAATASVSTNESEIFADVLLLPGDSGGPIFNSEREVVGVISGGWFWMDRGVVSRSGVPVTVTWPARGCNAPKIRGLLRRVARHRMAKR